MIMYCDVITGIKYRLLSSYFFVGLTIVGTDSLNVVLSLVFMSSLKNVGDYMCRDFSQFYAPKNKILQ